MKSQKRTRISRNPALADIRTALIRGECSVTGRVTESLSRIKSSQLNAFISLLEDQGLETASDVDDRVRAGRSPGRLAGTILAVKDNINIRGSRTTCGSRILENYISPYHATVIERLLAEDAVLIGKTNMDEFAMGSSNETSFFGACGNPIGPELVPGGSSGGSAAAVAGGLVDAALGSDTGGSIRQPASFTGTVGLKPTYGRVSRYGLVAFASSFDQIGPITTSVRDAAQLLSILAGHDHRDTTTADVPVPDFAAGLDRSNESMTIGLPDEYFTGGLSSHIRQLIEERVELLKRDGHRISAISLPHTGFGVAAYYILATAEASSNLARYDGVKFGYRADDADNLDESYRATRAGGFGEEVKRRIMLGTYGLSSGYYDQYYRKAQKVRRLIKNDFDAAFRTVDAIITPTTPTVPFARGEKLDDPLDMYLSDIYTVSANLAGICAISLPAGLTDDGLPVGIQIMCDRFNEEKLLQLAYVLEQST